MPNFQFKIDNSSAIPMYFDTAEDAVAYARTFAVDIEVNQVHLNGSEEFLLFQAAE